MAFREAEGNKQKAHGQKPKTQTGKVGDVRE